ncbi:uncharacterized protein N7459_000390 [Penicillium hispanicum]|uniref:uncharacterized protein n=1 Tax=Penicillium hispanicum TaxID=1080232 RepID=UPI00254118B5|nr:uncharacterized protein N7459_000390 [Penicillium hispanicum]KAJ5594182.1 hypothetical protein N7459_000390 [Penicillium hispanicum]
MVTRTSRRQAAQKAKEAISTSTEASGRAPAAEKRKAATEKAPKPKREKKDEAKQEEKAPSTGADGVSKPKPEEEAGPGEKAEAFPEAKPIESTQRLKGKKSPVMKPKEEPIPTPQPPEAPAPTEQPSAPAQDVELGVRKSEERENVVSSNILEKGIIYFFYRPRVSLPDPQSMDDISRSFMVLRPTPLGAELDESQGSIDKDARCRLLILPKKKFPTSPKERDMGFVEKAGQTMKDLQEKFIASSTYHTSTRGERTVEEAKPYAEGVYALTSTYRASHLAYVLTIPAHIGEIQENFGLHERGSWIVQSKNPKFPGPPIGRLPKEPEYPESVRAKFGDLRWVPMQPEFIEYPNSQFLMIGEAQDKLGKAATAEGRKQEHEEEPGQEIEKLEQENEHRIGALQGDQTIFEDLGMHAKQYPALPTTWNT